MSKRTTPIREIVLIFAILLAGPAAAQDCINYGEYLHFAGQCYLPARANGITVDGNLIYVACGQHHPSPLGSVQIIDISEPEEPSVIGMADILSSAMDVAYLGDRLYVANADQGLTIVDVSDPTSPNVVGHGDTPGFAAAVDVDGDLVYVADMAAGLQVINVSNPRQPVIVGTVVFLEAAYEVFVADGIAYVANGNAGLKIIDVSDPATPTVISAVETPGEALGVTLASGYAYVADGESGIQVVDVTNPLDPVRVGDLDLPGCASRVTVVDDLGCVACGYQADVVFLDLSEPANPVAAGFVNTSDWVAAGPSDVILNGDYAYVAELDGSMKVVDVRNPHLPPLRGTWASPATAYNIVIDEDLAYLNGPNGLTIVDVTVPMAPVVLGEIESIAFAGLAVLNRYAFASVQTCLFPHEWKLVVIDVADPGAPIVVHEEYMDWGIAGDVVVYEDWIVVNAGSWGTAIFDVSDPAAPVQIGSIDVSVTANIGVSGSYLYLTDGDQLAVVDASDPHAPHITGYAEAPGNCQGVAVVGDLVYTAAYLGISGAQLLVVDVSIPSMPTVAASVGFPTGVGAEFVFAHCQNVIEASPRYVYFASGFGLQIFDIADPISPSIIGMVPIRGLESGGSGCFSLALMDDRILLPAGDGGLKVAWPQCDDVVGIDDHSSEPGPGEEIPAADVRLIVHPNPFNPQTSVSFSLPRAGLADVSVYDLTGRQVTSLASRAFDAGYHTLTWTGRDSGGRAVPSGTYIVRLETEDRVESKKVMLVR